MDQSEINRIIVEASKGSKFYEREIVKDEELGRKINATLRKVSQTLGRISSEQPLTPAYLRLVLRGTSYCRRPTFRDWKPSVTGSCVFGLSFDRNKTS
jgi:hypothetical protein